MRLTFGGSVLLAALAAWTCGIPDLAEKKDAAGVCKAKVDCSGCGSCQQLCMCVSAADISACIASCEIDAGVGGSGGGSGGSGASDGGVDASSGGEGATGGIQNGGQGGIAGGGTTSSGGSGGGGTGGTGGGLISCIAMAIESTAEACSDQCDNDGDKLIDCQDPDCGGFETCKKTIPCGTSSCDLFTSYCCYGSSSFCQTPTSNCTQTTAIHCAGPADCGLNQVCCGFMLSQPDFHYDSIGCVAPSNCDYASGGRVFCGGNAGVCPPTLPCAASNLVTGYFVCDSK